MTDIWLSSYLCLWILVVFLLLAVFTLARQIGLLHRRLPPFGAMMTNDGPEVGARAPELEAVDLRGRPAELGRNQGKKTLLLFVSPMCDACAELAPAVRRIWKSERQSLQVVIVSLNDDEAANQRFAARYKLRDLPYVMSRKVAVDYRILSAPYGLLIDQHGVIRAKGVVNNLEHLESLLNAGELGHSSQESLLQMQHASDAMVEEVSTGP